MEKVMLTHIQFWCYHSQVVFRNLQSLIIFIVIFLSNSTETRFICCPNFSATVCGHWPFTRTLQVPKHTVPTSAYVPFHYRRIICLPYAKRACWMRLY